MGDLTQITKTEANKIFLKDIKDGIIKGVTIASIDSAYIAVSSAGYLEGHINPHPLRIAVDLALGTAVGYVAWKELKRVIGNARDYVADPAAYMGKNHNLRLT